MCGGPGVARGDGLLTYEHPSEEHNRLIMIGIPLENPDIVSCLHKREKGDSRISSRKTMNMKTKQVRKVTSCSVIFILVSCLPTSLSFARFPRIFFNKRSMSDPFDVFGDETIRGGMEVHRGGAVDDEIRNEEENGPLRFHEGTEEALWHYVQQNVKVPKDEEKVDPQKILQLVDKFCYTRHWMMHLGDVKGPHLDNFLKKAVREKSGKDTFVLVEVGTYCGYSMIRMADILSKECKSAGINRLILITVDVSEKNVRVAKRMVGLTGFEVSFLILKDPLNVVNELSETIKSELKRLLPNSQGSPCVDFLFLDHEKDLYLSDLRQMEASGMIQAKTFVAADNVVFFKLDEYRQHVNALAKTGVVKTELIESELEYLRAGQGMPDGIGKFS